MIKLYLIPLILLLMCFGPVSAQTSAEEEVKSAIHQMFEGMRKGDSAMVKAVFDTAAIIQTVLQQQSGKVVLRTGSLEKFLSAVGAPHTDVWDERIRFDKILIDGPMASVWTPYSFYLGGKFSHCGVNSFQLCKSEGGWKIIYLADTRRKEGCL